MKKWGLFLAMLTIAAAFAFADDLAASQGDDLFADIEAVALSQGEMEADSLFFGIHWSIISDEEMKVIQGDGVSGAVAGGIVGGALSGVWESCKITYEMARGRNPGSIKRRVLGAMRDGAVTGAFLGLVSLIHSYYNNTRNLLMPSNGGTVKYFEYVRRGLHWSIPFALIFFSYRLIMSQESIVSSMIGTALSVLVGGPLFILLRTRFDKKRIDAYRNACHLLVYKQ